MFNLLLVDDEELALASLRYALPWEAYGFTNIQTTTSASEALQILTNQHIDACFLDIRMPVMNGFELLAKTQPYNIDTVFVIVSGYSEFSYARQAIQYNVQDYCLKPIDIDDCIPTLEKITTRIYSNRIAQDSSSFSKMLTDQASCSNFLFDTSSEDSCTSKLPLLFIHHPAISKLIRQIDELRPSNVFFTSTTKALLIWKSLPATDALDRFILEHQHTALLIQGFSSYNAPTFQNIIRQLYKASENSAPNAVGFMQLPSIGESITTYFHDILSYIETHYSDRLNLAELAHMFGVNYNYLSQLFKKNTGVTFIEYLTNIRMIHARRLLTETPERITDIAANVGFDDYHYFCNTFKRYHSYTPSEYRRLYRKDSLI